MHSQWTPNRKISHGQSSLLKATLNNISVRLWPSVLFVEETRVSSENHKLLTIFITWSCIQYTLQFGRGMIHNWGWALHDCIGWCKSNYYMYMIVPLSSSCSIGETVSMYIFYTRNIYIYILSHLFDTYLK